MQNLSGVKYSLVKPDKHILTGKSWNAAEPDTASAHELILKKIRLLSIQRIAWLRKIWGEMSAKRDEGFNAHVEVDGYLYDADVPSLESYWMATNSEMTDLSYSIEKIEVKLLNDKDSRFNILIRIFNLNKIEADVLQLCFAHALDTNLGRVFAYMHDHSVRSYVTETLVARLFRHGHYLLLHADSQLKIWGLVREIISSQGEPARLECDPFIKAWLLGLDGIDEALIPYTNIQPVKKPLLNWPVKEVVAYIKRVAYGEGNNKVRIFISGAESSGRRSFAAIVCKQIGLALLSVNTERIAENRWQQIYMQAQRQAWLSGAALAWYGSGIGDKFWPQNIGAYPVQFVIGETDDFIKPEPGFIDLRIDLPAITLEERFALWQKIVPQSAGWQQQDLEEMILRYEATIGQIVSVGQRKTQTINEAYNALRADVGHRLGSLAQQMNSNFTWDDLVVPPYIKKGLGDFIFEATERIRFWEEPAAKRLFPQGKSLIALFTGNPGTGKTMAAQVIANSLKLDLFRIDLSTVVSKYIGESSKNIERILARAKSMNVVLFFDEADSLFGKRTDIKDAHDRYANTDTNYLLQAIEEYPGIIILASNKKANIDTGFMRRLRYLLEFSKPNAEQRLSLWRKIIRELAGEENATALNDDLSKLSEVIEITGAQIKLTVLSAVFMARRDKTSISYSHLLRGLEQELIKEGRGLGRQLQQTIK